MIFLALFVSFVIYLWLKHSIVSPDVKQSRGHVTVTFQTYTPE